MRHSLFTAHQPWEALRRGHWWGKGGQGILARHVSWSVRRTLAWCQTRPKLGANWERQVGTGWRSASVPADQPWASGKPYLGSYAAVLGPHEGGGWGHTVSYCKLQHVGREAWGQLACVARALVRWPGRSQQRVGGLDGYFGGGDMGSLYFAAAADEAQRLWVGHTMHTNAHHVGVLSDDCTLGEFVGSLWGVSDDCTLGPTGGGTSSCTTVFIILSPKL